MSWFRAPLRGLLLLALFMVGGMGLDASEIPGLTGGNRAWVALLIEDHAAMREMLWDPAFTNLDAPGPFLKNHRYAIQTKFSTGLVDLGCADEAWPVGNGWRAPAPVLAVALSKDGSGAILTSGGKSTWLPVAAAYDGKATPTATLRGAYLNWLLANRGTTPSIPRETRWQRLQRGAQAVVRDLLTRSGGQPEFRVVGIGTSGRLLIPPGEGLPAGLNAVGRMEPSDSGSMLGALNRALETVQNLKIAGACEPGIVLPIGDGFTLSGGCGAGTAYEPSGDYSAMLATVRAIRDTAQAEVWAWSVEGPRTWSKDFATLGLGQLFSGDAVAALDAAIKLWMTRHGQPLQLTLSFDQPTLTRVPQVTLTVRASHGLASATLNGQPLQTTGLETKVPLTLREGLNTFTVIATDLCGSQAQASASITLDTIPPRITLNPVPPALTNQTALTLQGRVDDLSATLTLNGQPLAFDAQGAFTAPVQLQEGQNPFAFLATDPAGNTGRLDAAVVRDTLAPVVTFTAPLEGFLTNAATLTVTGIVSDPTATFTLNGTPVLLSPQGAFSLTITPPEGPLTLTGLATDPAGNVGRGERRGLIDRTAPIITLNPVPPNLVSATSLTLQGQVDDPKASLRINDQVVPLDVQGSFALTLPLTEGANAFVLIATDLALNAGRLDMAVTRDTLAPVVHFTDPIEGFITNVRQLNLSGQVDDLSAVVQVEGRPMTLDATGFFTTSVDTLEGPMTFSATATDPAGNVGRATRSILVDWTAPVITLDAPVPVLISATAYAFNGRVDDPQAAFTVNGQTVPLDADGRFSLTLSLVEGLNAFRMEATDVAGNLGTLDATILRDTIAPVIRLDAPAEGLLTNALQIQVQGQVDDLEAAVFVNGQAVTLDAAGRFGLILSPNEGPFTVVVTATDLVGNASQEVRHILVDRTAPRITLTRPVPVLTNQPRLQLVGGVDDPSALLTLQGQAVAMDASGVFEIPFTLSEGFNFLAFVAQDKAGNTGTLTVTVALDTVPPVLTVETPLEGLRTNAPTLAVQGRVDDLMAAVTVDGTTVALGGAGAFTQTLTPAEGPLTIQVLATDLAGNAALETRHVLIDRTAPRITVTTVIPSVTTDKAITLQGVVDDPSAALTMNGQSVSLDGSGAFTVSANLAIGANTFTFHAADKVGNVGTLQVGLTREYPILVLTPTQPNDGVMVLGTTVPVAGMVSEAEASIQVNGLGLTVDPSGSFAGDIPVNKGENRLVFVASTVDGRSATATRTVNKPLGGNGPGGVPVVTFLFPQDGYVTNAKAITVVGRVDDPTATLVLQGKELPIDAEGGFELTLGAEKEGVFKITAVATNPYGNGQAVTYASFDWTPPVLAWINPTPAEGARLTVPQFTAAAAVNEPVLASINGVSAPLEPSETVPYQVQTDLTFAEGQALITVNAVDRAGNKASLSRALAIGLTAPQITILSPAFVNGAFSTVNTGVTLTGTVTASEAVKPLTFTINGQTVNLDAEGKFSFPMKDLAPGANPVKAVATTAFGQTATQNVVVTRVLEGDPTTGPAIQIDSPLEGFSAASATMTLWGRVNQPGLTVQVQGQNVIVDPVTLRFTALVTLSPGAVTLSATATDAAGSSASAAVHGLYIVPGFAHYRWDLPATGFRSKTRTVHATGQADLPGIASISINGTPMSLSGRGTTGAFEGDVTLAAKGPNALLMEVRTLAGERFTERRDVIFEPELPRIRLQAPDGARSGDQIDLKVEPEPGTTLVSADLSWNGALLAHLTAPFDSQKATVPMGVEVGSRLLVEAFGRDAEGETVTARAYVTVIGSGVLIAEVFDDRTGLALPGGTASIEGTTTVVTVDAAGRAALPTALPRNWVRLDQANHSSVWRSAALQVAGVQAVVDARPTPLAPGQDAGSSAFDAGFAGDTLKVAFPAGALNGTGKLSLTPLSTQGLPGLLPMGWSAVAAAWLQADGLTFVAPGSLDLTLPSAAPEQDLVWARWDAERHGWVALAVGLSKTQLTQLTLPTSGGFALLVADAAPTAPPPATLNALLLGTDASAWRDGLAAAGNVTPGVLPTTAAIRGARAMATFTLGWNSGTPIPSGTLIQTDVVETYVLVNDALIEPERRTQDGVATRFAAVVDASGKPAVHSNDGGLLLELPVRMSRTFQDTELVEGLIQVGFYHDGLQVAQGGSLLGLDGGTVRADGLTVTFAPGSFNGPTLVRLSADPTAPWTELAGQGTVKSPFLLDIVGTLQQGFQLKVNDLGVIDAGITPLLVQRRIVQGQRVVLAVGHLEPGFNGWNMVVPQGGNAILEGGAFAVLVPNQAWSWVSGTATLPTAVAAAIQRAMNPQTPQKETAKGPQKETAKGPQRTQRTQRTQKKTTQSDKPFVTSVPFVANSSSVSSAVKSRNLGLAAASGEDVAVSDALVSGNFLSAASGATGAFAAPAFALSSGKLTLTGQRWDLGVRGSVDVDVPSTGNALRLSAVPFAVLTILPGENAEVGTGAILTVLLSAPADPATLNTARLMKDVSEVNVRRDLSLDGRTLLLTPDPTLEAGVTYQLVLDGLRGLAGDTAPAVTRTFHTAPPAPPIVESVDFSRIVLSYPDENLNITITVPEGVLPTGVGLSLEAFGMGSTYSGQMPAKGDLVVTFKASLGERIKVSVQFPSGKVVEGYVSRYVSGDGRVTVSVDGGRIEANDGSGASVILPPGALDAPAELSLSFTKELPAELDSSLLQYQDRVVGRIEMTADREVTLKLRPIIQIPAPANASTAQHSDGLGAYAIFDKVSGFEDDNTPATWFEMGDTAALEGTNLVSKGGLPVPTEPQALISQGPAPLATAMGPQRSFRIGALPAISKPLTQKAKSSVERPMASFGGFFGGFGLFSAFMIDSGPHYVSGFADIQVGAGDIKPADGAFVFFAPSGGMTLKRGGQMLQRTGETGSYLLASFLTDELVRGGGQMMGIDKDWGVRAFSGTSWGGPGGIFGTYFHAPTMHFKVTEAELGDKVAPFVDLRFHPLNIQGVPESREFFTSGETVTAMATVHDDRTEPLNLAMTFSVDGKPLPYCNATCKGHPDWTKLLSHESTGANTRRFRFNLGAFAPGRHTILIQVFDEACNKTEIRKEFLVGSFPEEKPSIPSTKPRATLTIDGASADATGKLTQAPLDALLKLEFTEPVFGGTADAIKLQRQDGTNWITEPTSVYNRTGKSYGERTSYLLMKPLASLTAGATYRLDFTFTTGTNGASGVHDLEELPIENSPLYFGTANFTSYPPFKVDGTLGKIGIIGNRLFAMRDVGTPTEGPQQFTFNGDGTFTPGPRFGAMEGMTNLLGQSVDAFQVFPGVSLGDGSTRSLLLITTSPSLGDYNHQSVLWAFDVCDDANPRLLFALSLGPGSSGYTPSVDCRDGLIVAGRLVGSILLIDIQRAITGWQNWLQYGDERGAGIGSGPGSVGMVRAPRGVNQQAIVQPFYLSNPEGTHIPTQPGVALLPATSEGIPVAVGYLTADGLRGLPTSVLPMVNGSLQVMEPFVAGANPDVDIRAHAGPALTSNTAVARVASIGNYSYVDATGTPKTSPVAIGQGTLLNGPGGNQVFLVDESDPKAPVLIGIWPKTNPFGGANYEIFRRTPAIDPDNPTKVAFQVNVSGVGYKVVVLDISAPDQVKAMAMVDGYLPGSTGPTWMAMGGGRMVIGSGGAGLKVVELTSAPNVSAARKERFIQKGEASMQMQMPLTCFEDHSQMVITNIWPDRQAPAYRSYRKGDQGKPNVRKFELISVPVWDEQNVFNTERYDSKVIAPYFKLELIRKPDVNVTGLNLHVQMDKAQSNTVRNPWEAAIYTNQPLMDNATDPTFRRISSTTENVGGRVQVREVYQVRPTFRNANLGVESLHPGIDWPPSHLTYYTTIVGTQLAPWLARSEEKRLYAEYEGVWPMWAWKTPSFIGTYSTADRGGDKWAAPGVYRFLETFQYELLLDPETSLEEKQTDNYNRNMVVNIGDVSGEHGRDLGHGTHRWGTDIDFIWPQPIPGLASGTANFDTMKGWIQNKETVRLAKWVLMARERLERLLKHPRVKVIYFTQKQDFAPGPQGRPSGLAAPCRAIWQLLKNGKTTGIDLGIGEWEQGEEETWLNKLQQSISHWNHFHVAFDEEKINTFGQGPGDLSLD